MSKPSDSSAATAKSAPTSWISAIGPGILIAATGVGAGDLATGAFSGSKLGLVILWAVLVGTALKFVVNEGLARWQLATGTTLLEGTVRHLGWVMQWLFLIYLVAWSFFVGTALMSAVGVTAHAIWPLFDDPSTSKVVFGIVHSIVALVLVRLGGFKLFEVVMSFCIAVMFVVVLTTASLLVPSWWEFAKGAVIPQIPDAGGTGLVWTIALMGGVGGTLTVLCYGYWIREKGRCDERDLTACRIDLAVGYTMTALFGMSMVVIGSVAGTGGAKGAMLIVHIADHLAGEFGGLARWLFLAGAWGAVFSSLLGVWQSVPYLFADFCQMLQDKRKGEKTTIDRSSLTKSAGYKWYLTALAVVPALGMMFDFQTAQKIYAVVGAFFVPMLAFVLLLLNGSTRYIGRRQRNTWLTNSILLATVIFFLVMAYFQIRSVVRPAAKKAALVHFEPFTCQCWRQETSG